MPTSRPVGPSRPGPNDLLVEWTERLTGFPPDQVRAAQAGVEQYGLRASLGVDSLDDLAAAVLLIKALDRLSATGIPKDQMLKKLRRVPEFWATYAELLAADALVHRLFQGAELRLEVGKSAGAHPDFRFWFPDAGDGLSVEFKAVGLSDEEAEFCTRVMPAVERMLPPVGVTHGHAPLGVSSNIRLTRADRRTAFREAGRKRRNVPHYPEGLRASVFVGQGSEASYLRRIVGRIRRAAEEQLPRDEMGWVALSWSNGAPVAAVVNHLDWDEMPANLGGLIFVGSAIAFPMPVVHTYIQALPRGLSAPTVEVRSELDDGIARTVRARFERSSGVRATLLAADGEELLRRDGRRRIAPFNVLMDADPPGVVGTTRRSPSGL